MELLPEGLGDLLRKPAKPTDKRAVGFWRAAKRERACHGGLLLASHTEGQHAAALSAQVGCNRAQSLIEAATLRAVSNEAAFPAGHGQPQVPLCLFTNGLHTAPEIEKPKRGPQIENAHS